jgi:hypothetical protein
MNDNESCHVNDSAWTKFTATINTDPMRRIACWWNGLQGWLFIYLFIFFLYWRRKGENSKANVDVTKVTSLNSTKSDVGLYLST